MNKIISSLYIDYFVLYSLLINSFFFVIILVDKILIPKKKLNLV